MKVLIVDDSSALRNAFRRSLGPLGFLQITEAGNGQEALARVSESLPDLILVNWHMPVMDGVAFTRAYRKLGHATPILMAASEHGRARVVEAANAGVTNYLIKPFSPDQLREAIAETLERAAYADVRQRLHATGPPGGFDQGLAG